jgi:hypothetical protein
VEGLKKASDLAEIRPDLLRQEPAGKSITLVANPQLSERI